MHRSALAEVDQRRDLGIRRLASTVSSAERWISGFPLRDNSYDLPICAAQSKPASEFVAYSTPSSAPKLGDHPVALEKVKSLVTVPVE